MVCVLFVCSFYNHWFPTEFLILAIVIIKKKIRVHSVPVCDCVHVKQSNKHPMEFTSSKHSWYRLFIRRVIFFFASYLRFQPISFLFSTSSSRNWNAYAQPQLSACQYFSYYHTYASVTTVKTGTTSSDREWRAFSRNELTQNSVCIIRACAINEGDNAYILSLKQLME